MPTCCVVAFWLTRTYYYSTAVCTLLFCAGPIEGCSAVLAVPTVDTAAVAFGAWFVLCPAEEKQAQKQKLRLVVFQS